MSLHAYLVICNESTSQMAPATARHVLQPLLIGGYVVEPFNVHIQQQCQAFLLQMWMLSRVCKSGLSTCICTHTQACCSLCKMRITHSCSMPPASCQKSSRYLPCFLPWLQRSAGSLALYQLLDLSACTSSGHNLGHVRRLSESFGYLNKKGFCVGSSCHIFTVVMGEFNVNFGQTVSPLADAFCSGTSITSYACTAQQGASDAICIGFKHLQGCLDLTCIALAAACQCGAFSLGGLTDLHLQHK